MIPRIPTSASVKMMMGSVQEEGFGVGDTVKSQMDHSEVVVVQTSPSLGKEGKPCVVVPRTVRIFWEDKDATNSSNDGADGDQDDGEICSRRCRVQQCVCEIQMTQPEAPVQGKVNCADIVLAAKGSIKRLITDRIRQCMQAS